MQHAQGWMVIIVIFAALVALDILVPFGTGVKSRSDTGSMKILPTLKLLLIAVNHVQQYKIISKQE